MLALMGEPIETPRSAVPVAANVLEYRRGERPEMIVRRRAVRVGLFVLSLAGAISVFLPFAYGESPMSVVSEWMTSGREGLLALIGAPFFAGLVAMAWKLRLSFSAPPSRAARSVVYLFAGMLATSTGVFCAQALSNDMNLFERLQVCVAVGLLVVGLIVVTWLGLREHRNEAATAAIYFAYAANATMCLLVFADSAQAGWWMTLGVVGVMGAEMALTIVETALGR
jgi:hypothetical protein